MLFIRVERDTRSYNYKKNPKAKDAWDNNDGNNGLDTLSLFDYESCLFTVKCQTVANIPDGRFVDTIAPGPFLIKCFLDKRNFYCDVHGICDTVDLENEYITKDSIQASNNLRWLIHDDQKLKPNSPNQLTRVLWSAGCFVLHKSDLEGLNDLLRAYGIKPGDTIDGELLDKEVK